MQKIILRNRNDYNEKLELTLGEFQEQFQNEIRTAMNIYKQQRHQADMLLPFFMTNHRNYKSDFYFDLRWNFNNNAPSPWYIDRIL